MYNMSAKDSPLPRLAPHVCLNDSYTCKAEERKMEKSKLLTDQHSLVLCVGLSLLVQVSPHLLTEGLQLVGHDTAASLTTLLWRERE